MRSSYVCACTLDHSTSANPSFEAAFHLEGLAAQCVDEICRWVTDAPADGCYVVQRHFFAGQTGDEGRSRIILSVCRCRAGQTADDHKSAESSKTMGTDHGLNSFILADVSGRPACELESIFHFALSSLARRKGTALAIPI